MARLAPWLAVATLGCATYAQRLDYATQQSRAMRIDMRYAVYTPPGFSRRERLPLMVFLHGGGDSYRSFDRHGVGQRLDASIASGTVPRVVVVVPDGHLGFWANWQDGSRLYEDWVVHEVMPAVARDYGTASCPDGCHVMGVSMGGAGTLRFVFHHKHRFASAAVISAPVLDTDAMLDLAGNRLIQIVVPTHRIWGEPTRHEVMQEDPFVQWNDPDDVGVRLYLAWAEGDRGAIADGSERLHRHLAERGIEHEAEEFAGGHDWASWGPVIERSIAHAVAPQR